MLGLWGVFAFLSALVPRPLAAAVEGRLWAARAVAVLLAVAATALLLPIEAAAIGDGWGDALDPGTLWSVLLDTGVGFAWRAQAVAVLLLALALLSPVPRRCAATAAAAGLVAVTLTLAGHASMHEGWLGVAHRANDALHLLAAGAWLGALVPLLPLLRALDDPATRRPAGAALRRFSTAGHGAVALVVATGTLNAALVTGGWPLGWASAYRALLSVKVATVAAMVGLAVTNRYVLVPRMAGPDGASARAVRRVTLVELALGCAVLALVSVFGLLDPA